ncbi:hypothetical protein, conserved [Leishmania shawi]|uniref:Flagellum attachment zone protein 12 n=1 Tax=Leishmania shawi TaxID=5680 RepID=A0ABR3E889_9TRYP
MKQINVETAAREQLVDFIRCMHPQLQREQERVRELESQVSGLQSFIQEKNAEIRELRQQSDRLTEKSASDEETISTLIKQMEGMRSGESPLVSVVPLSATTGVQRGRTAERGKRKWYPSADAAGGEYKPETHRPLDTVGNGDVGRRASRTPPPVKVNAESALEQLKSQNAAATAAIATKMEEVFALEKKVRELTEVNAFYSAIVSQHDQEEKVRMSQALGCYSGHSDDDVAGLRQEVERLQLHISSMADRGEKLQRIIKAVECDKVALSEENEALKRELVLLEAEMEEMTREYARARKSLVAAARTAAEPSSSLERGLTFAEKAPQVRAASAPQQGLMRELPSRGTAVTVDPYLQNPDRCVSYLSSSPAPCVSPLARDERQSVIGGVATSAQTGSTIPTKQSHSRFTFRSLRPMRVRSPDAHERELLDRIHFYEDQFAQMEAFEADRQRSFDEMERNRAELFVSMNSQLEKQRKEIYRLRKLHEETSIKSSATARPSHNHSLASLPSREEEGERGSSHRRGPSPVERSLTAVPTSLQSLHFDSLDNLDAADNATAAWVNERESALSCSRHRRQVSSEALSTSFGLLDELMWREKHARSRICTEAVEEELQLFAGMHIGTVRLFAGALEAREAHLLCETADLRKDVGALQARVVDLEAQLAIAREAEKVLLGGATDSEAIGMTGVSDPDSPETNLLYVATSLSEKKTLYTAFMALEAYGAVLEYHRELIKICRLSSSGAVEVVELGEDCMHAEIARDLEEVQMVLDSVRCLSQLQPSLSHAATPHLYDTSSAPRIVGELLTACETDTGTCDEEADVAVASSRDQSSSHLAPPQTFSQPTQTQIASLSSHTDVADREEEIIHGVAEIAGELHAISYVPPDIFSQEQAAAVVTKASGDDAVPLPLSIAEAVTDISPFQDSLEEEHSHISAATSGDGSARTADSGNVSPMSHKTIAASFNDGYLPPGKKKLEAEREAISSTGVTASVAEPRQVESSVAESADLHKEDDAREEYQASDGAEDESSEAHDDGTLSSTSQLEVTEGEEVEFLAQLEKEMAKGGLEIVTEHREDEGGIVASPADLDIDNGGGEEREAGCGEGQPADSEVARAEASSETRAPPSCGADGEQQSRRGDTSQEKEGLDPVVLEDEFNEAELPMESPDERSDKSTAASSLSPNSDNVSEERSSTSPTSTTSSSLVTGTSTSGEGVHFESAVVRDHLAPQISVPVAEPPLLPPLPSISLDSLFGVSGGKAPSASAERNDGRQSFPASSALSPPLPLSDPKVSPRFDTLCTAMTPTPPPHSMLAPCLRHTPSRPYFSSFPSEEQQLQTSGGFEVPNSHDSSSGDDFEAEFDPFA